MTNAQRNRRMKNKRKISRGLFSLRKKFWQWVYVRIELPVYRRWGRAAWAQFFLKHLRA